MAEENLMSKEVPIFNRKLFNKGKRKIDIPANGRDIDGDYSFLPQSAGAFTEEEAAKLLRIFKRELIDMDNVTVESLVSDTAARRVEASTRLHEEEIAKRLMDARTLRVQQAYEDALKEGFTDVEARQIAGMPPAPEESDSDVKPDPVQAARNAAAAAKGKK